MAITPDYFYRKTFADWKAESGLAEGLNISDHVVQAMAAQLSVPVGQYCIDDLLFLYLRDVEGIPSSSVKNMLQQWDLTFGVTAPGDSVLMESGDYILLESGDKLLLE